MVDKMGFWCCVVAPKTAFLFIPLLIYTWNRFLQPLWSKFWNKNRKEEIETGVKRDTNKNSLVFEEDCCDNMINTNAKNNSNRKKIN